MPASGLLTRLNLFNRAFTSYRAIPITYFSSSAARAMAQEYKLKDLSSLDLKDGEMQQVEVEGIEGGKVLLASTGGKVHAMSANCTHYGAPLSKGILSPEGTIRCPWHGACFRVSSGDVEDAPALDPLAKFDIVEKSGAFYIKGEEATIKANRRQPNVKCAAAGQEHVVVVGGGSGTIGFIQALREHGAKHAVTLLHKEPYLPIDRTKLSKALISDPNKLLLRPQEWYDSASIKTVQDEVKSIDFSAKTVSTASGQKHSYTKLVLATGGSPRNLPLPGFKTLKNIFILRSVPHVQEIMGAVGESKGKKVVVIGSGFIGLEVANALAKENNVTVVDMIDTPLKAVLGAEVGAGVQKMFENNGIKFHMNAGVEKAAPSSSDSSKVGAVHLKDGTALEADLVIVGVGVGPATEYLRDNPAVKLEKDGSLKVNHSYAVNGLSDVYAIGDIATFPYNGPTSNGAFTRIEHWNVSQNHGRAVGAGLADPKLKTKSYIPIFWSALGAQMRYCGNMPNGWDGLVLHGKPAEAKFAAYYCKGDTVGAVATMGMDPIMTKTVDLMERNKMLSKSDLEGGKDILAA